MSIYDDPAKYARMVHITERMAKIWCAEQSRLDVEMEAARVCPTCGKPTLVHEQGSYEENISEYVWCENDEVPMVDDEGEEYLGECDFVSEMEDKFEPLQHWYNFDILLASTVWDITREFGNLQEWFKYAKKEVSKIESKESA